MGRGLPTLVASGVTALLGAVASGDGETIVPYASSYVRTGTGVYEVTLSAAISDDQCIALVSLRATTFLWASIEKVSNTLLRVRTWGSGDVATDASFDLVVFHKDGSGEFDTPGILVAGIVASTGEPGSSDLRGGTVSGGAGTYDIANFVNNKRLAALGTPISTGAATLNINPIGDESNTADTHQLVKTGDGAGSLIATKFAFLAFILDGAYGNIAQACGTRNVDGTYKAYGGVLTTIGTGHYRLTLFQALPANQAIILAQAGHILFDTGAPVNGVCAVEHVSDTVKDIRTFNQSNGAALSMPFSILCLNP